MDEGQLMELLYPNMPAGFLSDLLMTAGFPGESYRDAVGTEREIISLTCFNSLDPPQLHHLLTITAQ